MNRRSGNPFGGIAQSSSNGGRAFVNGFTRTRGKTKEKMEDMEVAEQESADAACQVNVRLVPTGGNCRHEVVVPAGQHVSDCNSYTSHEAALVFPFELDEFQEEAIKCVDGGQSTIVSAPACAGKTLVAKYLLAKAAKERTRLLYICPYEKQCLRMCRELADEFTSVSYVSTHSDLATRRQPPATCIVMTVAVMNRLFQHGETSLGDMEWVVFDEAHMIGDKAMGALYEETLMLAKRLNSGSRAFKLLLLADPIPNVRQLAEWLAILQQTPCHFITPDERPTPQQHFIYTIGSARGLSLVVDRDHFSTTNFNAAMEKHRKVLGQRRRSSQGASLFQNGFSAPSCTAAEEPLATHVMRVLRTLHERNRLPCIVFCASEGECERVATALALVDFNEHWKEKAKVVNVFENALEGMAQEKPTLESMGEVAGYKPYLMRGVGIHHAGMLPVLNEITETLHDNGCIKVLLTVEALARETKLSARSAIITYSRKCDKRIYRPLTGDEYSLMAGRAGRRGTGELGLVVLMLEKETTAEEAERIMAGTPSAITSHFAMNPCLAAKMLMSRVDPVSLFKQTFYHHSSRAELPRLRKEHYNLVETVRGIHIEHEFEIDSYHKKRLRVEQLEREVKARVLIPAYIELTLCQTGRMLHIVHDGNDYKWGVLVRFQRHPDPVDPSQLTYVVDVAVRVANESARDDTEGHIDLSVVRPPSTGDSGALAIIPFTHDCIRGVAAGRLKLPEKLDDSLGMKALEIIIEKTLNRVADKVSEADPTDEMYESDPDLRAEWERWKTEKDELDLHPAARDIHNFEELYGKYREKRALAEKMAKCEVEIKRHEGLALVSEYDACRKLFAQYNNPRDRDGTLNAHELSLVLNFSSSSPGLGALILSQSLINGVFDALAPSSLAALLACFVPQAEKANIVKAPPELAAPLRRLRAVAELTATEAKANGLPDVSAPSINGHPMDAVRKLCCGAATFAEAVETSQLSEGAFTRCLWGVSVLLTEMLGALELLRGSPPNHHSLREALVRANLAIRRGIPFAKSLYTS